MKKSKSKRKLSSSKKSVTLWKIKDYIKDAEHSEEDPSVFWYSPEELQEFKEEQLYLKERAWELEKEKAVCLRGSIDAINKDEVKVLVKKLLQLQDELRKTGAEDPEALRSLSLELTASANEESQKRGKKDSVEAKKMYYSTKRESKEQLDKIEKAAQKVYTEMAIALKKKKEISGHLLPNLYAEERDEVEEAAVETDEKKPLTLTERIAEQKRKEEEKKEEEEKIRKERMAKMRRKKQKKREKARLRNEEKERKDEMGRHEEETRRMEAEKQRLKEEEEQKEQEQDTNQKLRSCGKDWEQSFRSFETEATEPLSVERPSDESWERDGQKSASSGKRKRKKLFNGALRRGLIKKLGRGRTKSRDREHSSSDSNEDKSRGKSRDRSHDQRFDRAISGKRKEKLTFEPVGAPISNSFGSLENHMARDMCVPRSLMVKESGNP